MDQNDHLTAATNVERLQSSEAAESLAAKLLAGYMRADPPASARVAVSTILADRLEGLRRQYGKPAGVEERSKKSDIDGTAEANSGAGTTASRPCGARTPRERQVFKKHSKLLTSQIVHRRTLMSSALGAGAGFTPQRSHAQHMGPSLRTIAG